MKELDTLTFKINELGIDEKFYHVNLMLDFLMVKKKKWYWYSSIKLSFSDETDSGLDIDATWDLADGVNCIKIKILTF